MRTCTKCGEIKVLDHYPTNVKQAEGRHTTCRDCRSKRSADWYLRNREARAVKARTYYLKNREKVKARVREYRDKNPHVATRASLRHQLALYGMSPDEYGIMMGEQNGMCALCGQAQVGTRRLSVDHCHTSGKVRGLLCSKCNTGLGLLGDTIDNLERAVTYLRGAA